MDIEVRKSEQGCVSASAGCKSTARRSGGMSLGDRARAASASSGRTSLVDRAEWDNFYIENFSLWLDLKIAVATVGAVFGAFGTIE